MKHGYVYCLHGGNVGISCNFLMLEDSNEELRMQRQKELEGAGWTFYRWRWFLDGTGMNKAGSG